MDFHGTFQGGKDMNLKLENSLVVLSQRKKEQGLLQRPTKKERNQELTQEERLLQHYQELICNHLYPAYYFHHQDLTLHFLNMP